MNKIILHLEGLTFLILSLIVYAYNDFSWVLFFVVLFSPDLSMIAYMFDKRIGAIVYNLFHTYIVSIAVILIGLYFTIEVVYAVGIIWTAHIGMDRMLGYGLKYSTDFKDTHLNRI